jgi:predicted transcriptional regulator
MNEAIHHFLAAMKDSKLERDEVAFLLSLTTGGKSPREIASEIKITVTGCYHIAKRLTTRQLIRCEIQTRRSRVYRLDTLGMTTIGKLAQSATTPEPVAHGIDNHPALL